MTLQISYEATSPTLLFMPHCDAHLYERVLRANWDWDDASLAALDAIPIDKDRKRGSLKHLRILGNCLYEYADRCAYLCMSPPKICMLIPSSVQHTNTQVGARFSVSLTNWCVRFCLLSILRLLLRMVHTLFDSSFRCY